MPQEPTPPSGERFSELVEDALRARAAGPAPDHAPEPAPEAEPPLPEPEPVPPAAAEDPPPDDGRFAPLVGDALDAREQRLRSLVYLPWKVHDVHAHVYLFALFCMLVLFAMGVGFFTWSARLLPSATPTAASKTLPPPPRMVVETPKPEATP